MNRILLEAKNSVFRQYQTFFLEQSIQPQPSSKRAEQFINEALSLGTGARDPQTAVENMVQPLLFRLAERQNAEADTREVMFESDSHTVLQTDPPYLLTHFDLAVLHLLELQNRFPDSTVVS